MAGGLLMLTFHQPNDPKNNIVGTLDEDLLFRTEALKSGLISADAMQAAGDPDPSLFATGPGAGLNKGVDSGGKVMITFNRFGKAAWTRAPFKKRAASPSLFEEWMAKVFSTPVECLVLAGHQQGSAVFGDHHTGLVPNPAARSLEIRPGLTSAVGASFDVTKAFSQCRLVLIWGCNGTSKSNGDWGPWRKLIANCNGGFRPLVLGFYKTHLWPRDGANEQFSVDFWKRVKTVVGTGGNIGSACEQKPLEMIDAWIESMRTAFANSANCNRHLFYQAKPEVGACKDKGRAGYGGRGAGAVAPDGTVWHVVDSTGKRVAVVKPSEY